MAQPLIQFTAGMIVTSPSRNGSNTRRKRWESTGFKPRPRQSMAVKKPLSTKNTGMRKPWIAANKNQKKPLCRSSWTAQGNGVKDNPACNAMPSSIAVARRASRS